MEQRAKRQRVSQSNVPRVSLVDALMVPRAIHEQYAGDPTPPLQVAKAADVGPQSSRWRAITGAAIAYGLTKGGVNAASIEITGLGLRIVAPQKEGDNRIAMQEAALRPTALGTFFQKYNQKKFPRDDIAKNVLEQECGVPREALDRTLKLIKKTAESVGFMEEIQGKGYIQIGAPAGPNALESFATQEDTGAASPDMDSETEVENVQPAEVAGGSPSATGTTGEHPNNRVFISHGQNRGIANQLKEMVKYGKLEPVLAVEEETVSQPVPQKVMDAMRSCFAGIIHVEAEEVVAGEDGSPKHRLNGNVLIEIGAALALYMPNLILLVEEGVQLPSNLQGLYECRYSGDKLDGDATMKVLKAFNDFS